ncbi:DUF3500 domain-containing protein [Porphyrobacter sp. CACIAM 03H1]|uniref:DUF3500 domain-containing protein n=1 Tax=Porphyrobacter sp. CACIAM 03H1 TaxID=2003315 RepID=UPI000B5A670D|nr:DUF3500 domain-containing protein [Porphyrobacter sp. CACIAM 03H1]ASJ90940.1 hypothetical protein CBR61_08430 [Porphyrobacter sp. CACIAM 03H1]
MRLMTIAVSAAVLAAVVPASTVAAHESPEHALEAARIEAMRAATVAFLASLDDDARIAVQASLADNARRTAWSNLPASFVPRSGVSVAQMNAAQRQALHAMLAAAFSSQGYLKTITSMWHEDVLHEMTLAAAARLPDGDPRKAQGLALALNFDSEKFFVTVFGDPAGKDWGWMMTGHHYAANFTVADGKIAFTPLFLGANPQTVPDGRFAGWRLLQHEADRAFALVGALTPAQRRQVVVADAVDGSVFAGKGRQDLARVPQGIPASALDTVQRQLLTALIDEYLGDASDEAAARQRAAIAADGPDKLYFSWWGPTDDPKARYMFRVQGPSIIIDYVREASPDGGFNHVHSIARDPSNDYGARWLEQHYQEAHQQ